MLLRSSTKEDRLHVLPFLPREMCERASLDDGTSFVGEAFFFMYRHPCVGFRFFTVWNFLNVLCAPLTHKVFDLLISTTLVSLGGCYLTYVEPRCLVLKDIGGEICILKGPLLKAVDLVFHQMTFLYVLYLYSAWGNCYVTSVGKTLMTCILFSIYGCFNDVLDRYRIDQRSFFALVGISFFIVLLLRSTPWWK